VLYFEQKRVSKLWMAFELACRVLFVGISRMRVEGKCIGSLRMFSQAHRNNWALMGELLSDKLQQARD
jgi:hypothetical protein